MLNSSPPLFFRRPAITESAFDSPDLGIHESKSTIKDSTPMLTLFMRARRLRTFREGNPTGLYESSLTELDEMLSGGNAPIRELFRGEYFLDVEKIKNGFFRKKRRKHAISN